MVEKSLLHQRTKRQKTVFANNRKRFVHTTTILQEWREKRISMNPLQLFDKFDKNSDLLLCTDQFKKMRDFLVLEILIHWHQVNTSDQYIIENTAFQ